MTQIEREEDALTEAYNNGEISLTEYNKEIQSLRADYAAEAREAAQDAYDREMGNW